MSDEKGAVCGEQGGGIGTAGHRYRYPGPRSFADDDIERRLFFGREHEATTLTHRVQAARILLLFGKSGLGKTSLLQACLFPRLRERGFLPVPVRFSQPGAQPVETVIEAVTEAYQAQNIDSEPEWGERDHLWTFFKTTDLWHGETLLIPVLVFDQFEEVFTLQDAAFRQALAAELRDLSARGLPPSARRRRETGERLPYSSAPPELRLVLSFREEYLAALEELAAEVPSLLENRFRLRALDAKRASRATTKPAALDEPFFITRPFRYAPATLEAMMAFLQNQAGEIEPFQLQLLCQEIEHKVAERQRQGQAEVEVDDKLLGGQKGMENILKSPCEKVPCCS